MQHPDEGIIHSWLDGALSAEDAANIESHVAGCQQCAAAVAEARGFIAASSRILTALDDVPRGVIPAVPARKRDLRVVWRAAAAMLVVAGGSLIVLREGGQDAAVSLSTDSAAAAFEPVTTSAAANSTRGEAAAVPEEATARQSSAAAPSARRAAPATAGSDLSRAAVGQAVTNERDFSGKGVDGRTTGVVVGGAAPTIAADMAAPPPAVTRASELDARAYSQPLRQLSTERRIGELRTTYQVAPTQTVTLTETDTPLALSSEAVTAGARMPQRTRAVSPMAAQAAAPPPAPEKSMQIQAAVPIASPFNTISWTEAATGKKLTLSGNVSVERLQEIKLSIERERAASRAKAP